MNILELEEEKPEDEDEAPMNTQGEVDKDNEIIVDRDQEIGDD
jgi:hypothetical protein